MLSCVSARRDQEVSSNASRERRTASDIAQGILAGAQAGRFVIEDFRPLAESIEWELGQQFWRDKGSEAFISDSTPVPFVINNDGILSQNAAQLLFSSLVEAEERGPLEHRLFVLELGLGVGLFARFFLDAFEAICRANGKDFYQRLCYVAGDRSERMLADACRHGIFANHPGHYVLRAVDALEPECLLEDAAFSEHLPTPFRAVFLNYLLDCLPAAHLRFLDNEASQLYVRTCLARNTDLSEYTALTPAELARLADGDRNALRDFYFLFGSEYDYRPLEVDQTPYGDFALAFSQSHAPQFLHSFGAIRCLDRLLPMVHEHGFILVNDYGQRDLQPSDDFEHQRFSASASVGVNFPLLKWFFADSAKCQWLEPLEDNGHIYSRLLGKAILPETGALFSKKFSKAAYDWVQEPLKQARANIQAGRFEAALAAYHEAMERQPYNWMLMNEIALYLTFTLRNAQAGIGMAKVALDLNPACSPELWNTLGDCCYECSKVEDAKRAYQRALEVNRKDVKARYNLAWVFNQQRDYGAALKAIADAFLLDDTGEFYDRLLKKQAETLTKLSARNQQRALLIANRVSRRAKDTANEEGRDGPPANSSPSK